SSQSYVADLELRNLEQLAQSTAGRISQLVAAMRGLADYVGTDDDFVAFLAHPSPKGTKETLAKLEALAKTNPDIQFVMVMDKAGNAIVATDRAVMGKNFKFREYFKEAIEGRAYMTGIIVGSVAGASGVFFSRPVYSADGKQVNGAVVMRVKADPIVRMLGSTTDGKDRQPFLVDGDGVIVWHPDEKMMFKSLVPLTKSVMQEIAADQRFRRNTIESINQPELAQAMVGGKGTGHVMYRARGSHRDQIAGWAAVPGNDWTVGVTESSDYFAAPLETLLNKALLGVLLVGAVFTALASMFARSIVKPVEKLTAAAHALKSGDYDNANIEVRSNDEVGQLARTFNVMIDVLRQRERERSGRSASIGFEIPPSQPPPV
ncbi:MAG TPA: cache domain-containing protein, partial [Usitatibacter sp.]|nr:cache domain-containing protein [Usitatibacter sp.]